MFMLIHSKFGGWGGEFDLVAMEPAVQHLFAMLEVEHGSHDKALRLLGQAIGRMLQDDLDDLVVNACIGFALGFRPLDWWLAVERSGRGLHFSPEINDRGQASFRMKTVYESILRDTMAKLQGLNPEKPLH